MNEAKEIIEENKLYDKYFIEAIREMVNKSVMKERQKWQEAKKEIVKAIKECIKECEKEAKKKDCNIIEYHKEHAEALGYKTSLTIIENKLRKFDEETKELIKDERS